jgi:cytochrome c biogenesis protein CcmG/thiol:disulfide interchange protein DsbE
MFLTRRRWTGIALAVVLAITAAFGEATSYLIPEHARKNAPDFALQDSTGSTVRLSKYKGKVVLLDFWATWCHGCKTEIPWYVQFQKKYRGQGLAAVGVSMDEEWTPVRQFLADNKVNYPIVIGSDDVIKLYKIKNMPVTLLIDKNGRIADWHVGLVNKAAFESEIQALLKEPATQSP